MVLALDDLMILEALFNKMYISMAHCIVSNWNEVVTCANSNFWLHFPSILLTYFLSSFRPYKNEQHHVQRLRFNVEF
jgi:hypothetical protein